MPTRNPKLLNEPLPNGSLPIYDSPMRPLQPPYVDIRKLWLRRGRGFTERDIHFEAFTIDDEPLHLLLDPSAVLQLTSHPDRDFNIILLEEDPEWTDGRPTVIGPETTAEVQVAVATGNHTYHQESKPKPAFPAVTRVDNWQPPPMGPVTPKPFPKLSSRSPCNEIPLPSLGGTIRLPDPDNMHGAADGFGGSDYDSLD